MQQKRLTWEQNLPTILTIASIVGLVASFVLTYDKIHVLQDTSYQPACNLNPVISCGSVMGTSQAMVFGVPNTLFGLIAFSMLATFSFMLLGGTVFKRRIWLAAQVMAGIGVIFVHYLTFVSVFQIHAICPWCFSVWMVTIATFFGITIRNIRAGAVTARAPAINAAWRFIDRHSIDLIVLWYGLIFGLLLWKFWYYWQTLL